MARISPRPWLWYLPALVGCLAAILFAAGFWLALSGSLGEPIGSPPPPPARRSPAAKSQGHRRLLVLGDSLARGTGDETGSGYALEVLDFLKKRGPAEIANLAVNGAESRDVLELLRSENVRALAASADLILLSAGANDLSHAIPRTSASAVSAMEELGRTRARFAANLRGIFGRLRGANPRAPLYVLGLYDPFGEQGREARLGASVILSWNAALEETALSFPEVFVVPTFDLFYGRADRLAVDHFHPNRKGYDAISRRIEQLIPDDL